MLDLFTLGRMQDLFTLCWMQYLCNIRLDARSVHTVLDAIAVQHQVGC